MKPFKVLNEAPLYWVLEFYNAQTGKMSKVSVKDTDQSTQARREISLSSLN